MLVKIGVVLLLLTIIGSLASGLYFILNDSRDSTRAVRALSWRIGLSVAAFILLMIGALTGVIESNAVVVG